MEALFHPNQADFGYRIAVHMVRWYSGFSLAPIMAIIDRAEHPSHSAGTKVCHNDKTRDQATARQLPIPALRAPVSPFLPAPNEK